MIAEEILLNMGFAFWYVLGETFLVVCALLLVFAIVLNLYIVVIKR